MILCDTNILIELYRRNENIVVAVETIQQKNIAISDVTRAELFVGALNKRELQTLRKDVSQLIVLPIQPEILDMAIKLLEEYCLSHKLDFHDALIAATAICHKIELFTLNIRDFVFLPSVKLFH
ncbi:putative ribonuclease VapC19 [Bacteroidales bacterium Barb4]|nr:putative ribonuclease VapC19 [Bacteroidales bacterium Barb4]